MAIQTRAATRHDRDAILTLWLELLREQSKLDARFEPADDAEERWRNDFDGWLGGEARRVLVAEEEEGELVAFLVARRTYPPPIYRPATEVFVDEIYVAEDHRQHGAGRALLEAARGWAEEIGAARIRASVLAENAESRKFWESQDARPYAVQMTIELDPQKVEQAAKHRPRLGF